MELEQKLNSLPPEVLAEIDELIWDKPFVPEPGMQEMAYFSPADEIFCGGKAGTGKSYLLLGLAVNEHTNSVIFRREFAQHKGGDGLIAKSMELIGENGRLNQQTGVWSNVFGYKTIELAGLENEKAVLKHKGRARDFIGFDEITEFTEMQYRTVKAWARTTIKGQRVRIVCTGNPPTTPEGEWVLRYWAPWLDPDYPNPAKPGELRWFITDHENKDREVPGPEPVEIDGHVYKPMSRTFIPGEMVRFLKETDYERTLQNLPEPLRSKLLYGDFTVKIEDDFWQVFPTSWIEAAMKRWQAMQEPDGGWSRVGADPARGGDDHLAIARRKGAWFAPIVLYPGREVPDGASSAGKIMQHADGAPINIDVIGIGSSPYDTLKALGANVEPIGFGEGSSETDKTGKFKFKNIRAQYYWRFREALDPEHGVGIALPPDPELKRELCAIKWKLAGDKIVIEPKEDVKARIGRSPDRADAVVLCWGGGGKVAEVEFIETRSYIRRGFGI